MGGNPLSVRHNSNQIGTLSNKASVCAPEPILICLGQAPSSLSGAIKTLNLPLGLQGIPIGPGDLQKLSEMAANDGCQTNPVKLDQKKYLTIFEMAKAL